MRHLSHLVVLTALLVGGCDSAGPGAEARSPGDGPARARPTPAAVDHERLVVARREPEQWMTTGGDYEERHYSALDRIDTENVAQLGLAWYADLDTNLTQEATPLVIDGVMYVTTAWSKLEAYDAATGMLLWEYDPQVPRERAGVGCCGVVNRGAAAWNGKIYVGTFDGRLVAVDARTGEEVWSTLTVDLSKPYSITGAPRVVKGLVVIGNGGAELGVRGYVSAYDAETGEKVWRFYTVPGNPADGPDGEASDEALAEIAQPTWSGEYWRRGGGGTVWDAIVYDPELDLLYVGVGNGSPWNASLRSPGGGDNLFLSSIVALRPDTGEYVWHFQQTPAETWDFTATMPMTVADLEIDGEMRRVLMQAPKNGFFYVLDAATGEFISASNVVPQNWALRLDPATGRPEVNPAARYDVTGEPTIIMPGPQAAHSWHPWAYSPDTGLVYLAARRTSMPMQASVGAIGAFGLGVDWTGNHLYDEPQYADYPREILHELTAWDPIAQEARWRRPLVAEPGAGVLATAGGLVFQGSSADQSFNAYDAETGEALWSSEVHTGVVAAPISYAVDGEQYVAVVVGSVRSGGSYYDPSYSRVLAYKLNGASRLPDPASLAPQVLNPPPSTATAETIERGRTLYAANCSVCHGVDGVMRGPTFPDLRYAPGIQSQAVFDAVVLDGARAANGMRGFGDMLTAEDSAAIRAYIVSVANAAKAAMDARAE